MLWPMFCRVLLLDKENEANTCCKKDKNVSVSCVVPMVKLSIIPCEPVWNDVKKSALFIVKDATFGAFATGELFMTCLNLSFFGIQGILLEFAGRLVACSRERHAVRTLVLVVIACIPVTCNTRLAGGKRSRELV